MTSSVPSWKFNYSLKFCKQLKTQLKNELNQRKLKVVSDILREIEK